MSNPPTILTATAAATPTVMTPTYLIPRSVRTHLATVLDGYSRLLHHAALLRGETPDKADLAPLDLATWPDARILMVCYNYTRFVALDNYFSYFNGRERAALGVHKNLSDWAYNWATSYVRWVPSPWSQTEWMRARIGEALEEWEGGEERRGEEWWLMDLRRTVAAGRCKLEYGSVGEIEEEEEEEDDEDDEEDEEDEDEGENEEENEGEEEGGEKEDENEDEDEEEYIKQEDGDEIEE